MIPASKPHNETERIAVLNEYAILDSLPEKEFDDLTQIAADVCRTPISLISLVEHNRQWFKSKVGIDVSEMHRDTAFCAHAILEPEKLFIVHDPAGDSRFHDNPMVTGHLNIAFYAGVPLVTEGGHALGTLCVMDRKPNDLNQEQVTTLTALARQVVVQFELRKKNSELKRQRDDLQKLNEDLTKFAYVVAHDIKSPCNSLAMSAGYLKDACSEKLDEEILEIINIMESTSLVAIEMVNGILTHTLAINQAEINKESFKFGDIIKELQLLITLPTDFTFEVENEEMELYTSKSVLAQVLQNLCNNAIKYNDKENAWLTVTANDTGNSYLFSVKDNGRGISAKDQESIFDLFKTVGHTDRFNNKGTGIGLATVKGLVEKMGGNISVNSEVGIGSNFIFTFRK